MHRTDIRGQLFVALSIFWVYFVPQSTWALTLGPESGVGGPASLSGHLSIFHDPSAKFTIEDIVSGSAKIQFKPIPTMLTEGYRKGAIWVRFTLAAPGAPEHWLLEIERPLIEQISLYVPDGFGHFRLSPPGYSNGKTESEIRAYPKLFPIIVSSTEDVYYIRFQSATSITTSLFLWQEDGYEKYRRSSDWMMAIMIGAIGAVMIANLLYTISLKDPRYLLYSAVLLESGLVSIFHMGYAPEIFYFLTQEQIYLLWGCIVCLYSIVMVFFLTWIFEFHLHNIWMWRFFQCVVFLNSIALLLSTAGRYDDVNLFVSRLQQLSYIIIIGYTAYLIIARKQHQYLLPAISFASVIAVSFVMQMQYTGMNPFFIDSSLSRVLAVSTLIHLILLGIAVANRVRLAERRLRAEQDRVLAISQATERELTIKVRERTAELTESNASLKAEIDRRHLLEATLKQSLDSVNDALAQQQDFVALVSHELRGPLGVIAATADNLKFSVGERADNIKLRVSKIDRTVRRMSTLIENVLAHDWLRTGRAFPAKIEVFDLNEILHAVEKGLDEGAARRVNIVQRDAAMVKGDRFLLEVAVQNLIQNALKYSAVTDNVTVRLSTNHGSAFINVTDQGSGVAPNDHDLIFMKYYRAAGQRERGSGLGLYISREIAKMNGGELVLTASDENGSTFCLSLPVEVPESA